MPKLKNSPPKYRKHKASGQAVVTIEGHDFYLGPYNSKASLIEYDRFIGEWLAAGRKLPRQGPESSDLTVVELLARYKKFAMDYYKKGGVPTGEWENVEYAIRPLMELYGRTLVRDFGPLALKAVRQKMIESGLSRTGINGRINRIKRVFRWGVSEQLVPERVIRELATVAGLEAGRSEAPETLPVEPVTDEVVVETLPHLPPVVADMVRFQRLVGCRPSETCSLRPCDVDRSGDVWRYVPGTHKTEHRGKQRVIFIGPKAQAVLLPYLLRDATAYCFSPADSESRRMARMRAERRTRVQPSQGDRSRTNPRRKPGLRYNSRSYASAVRRACKRAGVAHWSPNQLRHSAATEIRRRFGIEASRTVLGHTSPDTTLIYAERDLRLAADVMRQLG